nr:MAG TPA: hypothetical protein [Caudoviricetes sp.]
MTAEKENKVYIITEEQKAAYLAAGYDIRDDDGTVISYGNGRTIPYEDYAKLEKENAALKEELEELKKAAEPEEEPAKESAEPQTPKADARKR